jgi:hypothetical protein
VKGAPISDCPPVTVDFSPVGQSPRLSAAGLETCRWNEIPYSLAPIFAGLLAQIFDGQQNLAFPFVFFAQKTTVEQHLAVSDFRKS